MFYCLYFAGYSNVDRKIKSATEGNCRSRKGVYYFRLVDIRSLPYLHKRHCSFVMHAFLPDIGS